MKCEEMVKTPTADSILWQDSTEGTRKRGKLTRTTSGFKNFVAQSDKCVSMPGLSNRDEI